MQEARCWDSYRKPDARGPMQEAQCKRPEADFEILMKEARAYEARAVVLADNGP